MQCPHCKKDLPASILELFPKMASVKEIENIIMLNSNLEVEKINYLAHALAGHIPAPEKICPWVCEATMTMPDLPCKHCGKTGREKYGTGNIPPITKLVDNSSSVVVNPDVASEFPPERTTKFKLQPMTIGYNQARSECISIAQKLMAKQKDYYEKFLEEKRTDIEKWVEMYDKKKAEIVRLNSELEACRDANQPLALIEIYRQLREEENRKGKEAK